MWAVVGGGGGDGGGDRYRYEVDGAARTGDVHRMAAGAKAKQGPGETTADGCVYAYACMRTSVGIVEPILVKLVWKKVVLTSWPSCDGIEPGAKGQRW